MELVAGGRALVVSARKALHGREDLGWVVMLRDRTELQQLTRQLDAVGTMSAALRAQRHEFANQLHTIAGFMSIGEPQQAQESLARLAGTGPLAFPLTRPSCSRSPYLQAFLGAKGVEAERARCEPAARPGIRGPRPVHRTAGRHHGSWKSDRQRRERRRRRFRGRALGGSGSAGRTRSRRRPGHPPHSRRGFRRRPGCRGRRPRAPRQSSRRATRRRNGLRGRVPGGAWGWRCPGSSRAGAAGTCACWSPAPPAAREPCSSPRCPEPHCPEPLNRLPLNRLPLNAAWATEPNGRNSDA